MLLCMSLFLGLAIICKRDINYKDYIYEKLYQDYFDFSRVSVFYDKYFGGIFPLENIANSGVVSVFNDDLVYQSVESYEEGALLRVDYNYLVPAIENGIVVYIGNKEKYGNVVIVEGYDGIDIWYGNLCNVVVKNYDFINSGSYLGEACDNKIYVVYTKRNEFLNYKEYLN